VDAPTATRSVHDDRGAVFAEYVTLLVLVSIGCAAATVALGVPLTNLFIFQRAILLLPVP
jgi:Flp pilus assembly pilin Flp